jgi:hypothetical protein
LQEKYTYSEGQEPNVQWAEVSFPDLCHSYVKEPTLPHRRISMDIYSMDMYLSASSPDPHSDCLRIILIGGYQPYMLLNV